MAIEHGYREAVDDQGLREAARDVNVAVQGAEQQRQHGKERRYLQKVLGREVRAMNVYAVTDVDRDLLLAGADLEALLAEREKERLEPDEEAETRPNVRALIRLETRARAPREGRDAGD